MGRQGIIAVALVIVVVVLAWWLWPRSDAPEPVAEGPAPAASTPVPDARDLYEPEGEPLPPLEASDSLARETLTDAGVGEGGLAPVLEQEHLIRRLVASVAAVARGQSPRSQIGFLEPEEGFRAQTEGELLVVAPGSFARYEPLATAIGGLDAGLLAARYERLEPLFQTAYEELGEPGRFRTVLLQALDLLLATPVPTGPLELEDHVQTYVYADPDLEALAPAQKHLLRLGPSNQRIVQNKLRELRAAVAGARAR